MPARRRDITDAQTISAYRTALASHPLGPVAEAGRILGIHRAAVTVRLKTLKRKGIFDPDAPDAPPPGTPQFTIAPLPEDDVPVEQLVEWRKKQFDHKRIHEEASKLLPVKVNLKGPIGLLHFGDPHIDDDGTDIAALERHTELVRKTPGLFACNVGDTSNNWTGRLARLYGEQSTSAKQAWSLVEWFIGRCDWLYVIAGNHDLWSGPGDPLKWITKQQGSLYKSSECRIVLQFPNGLNVRVNARHDFAGHSQWNAAHGPGKALMLGVRDHIAIAGHRHESAHNCIKDPDSGILMHAIKVASYKVYDRFAREKGFRDHSFSPCCMTVIDPRLPETHPDLIKVWWEPEAGVDYLNWLRSRK